MFRVDGVRQNGRRVLSFFTKKKSKPTNVCSGTAAVLLMLAFGILGNLPVASAQEFSALEAIVITGETVERSVQESSTSTTVITGEELDEQPTTNLYDVLERTPGVLSAFGDKGFIIRGIDQRGPAGPGNGLLVNTMIDGVSLPSNQATFFGPYSTWDLEQVEVLRGPQSTQQGRNALAGAIILRTADPSLDGTEFKFRQDFETFDGRRTAAAINLPLIDNELAIRLSGEVYSSDGYVENPTRGEDDYDPRDLENIRAKVLVKPIEDLELIYGFNRTDNRGGEDFVNGALFPGQRVNFSDLEAVEGAIHEIHNIRGTYRFNDVFTLKSETSFYENDYFRVEDGDRSPLPGLFLGRDQVDKSFTQETKLAFENSTVKGAVGVYYTKIDTDDQAGGTLDVGLFVEDLAGIPVSFAFSQDLKIENLAFFGEADIKLFESDWTLTVGGRYDTEELNQTDTRSRDSTGIPPVDARLGALLGPDGTLTTTGEFEAFLPKIGFAYNWTPDIKSGFVVQRGYRAGGASLNLFDGGVSPYDPEFTWNYELYQRTQLFDGRVTINANAFYMEWTDQQVGVSGPSGNDFDVDVVNAGESTSYGGELSVKANVTDALKVFASYAFVRNRFEEFVNEGEDFSGNKFPYSPEHAVSFGAEYRFDNGVFAGFDANYQSEQEGDAANSDDVRIEERFLVNAEVGYAADHWTAKIFARNLFDEDYITQSTGGLSPDFRTGEPQVIGVSAQAKF